MHRLLIALSLTACTATVRTAGPPPSEPAPPPPPPPAAPAPAPAPPPGPVATVPSPPSKHPAYLRALADLRHARAFLVRPAGVVAKWDESQAIKEIDLTIREIKQASIDDGKDLDDHPPVDQPTWGGRLERALELLRNAQADVNEAEDNPATRQLKTQALKHIETTEAFVQQGIADAKTIKEPVGAKPGAHPAYEAALGSLRQARALLERPAGAVDVKWDEHVAIRDIDTALGEIRKAHVDDGRPMTEHAPIDSKLVYRDRLREAVKQLQEAARDIEEREDNSWAKPDRHRAVEAIRRAEKATHEAMSDRKDDKADKADKKAEKREEKGEKKAEKKAAKGH